MTLKKAPTHLSLPNLSPALADASPASEARPVIPRGPRDKVTADYNECEAWAAEIRNVTRGAWCEWDSSAAGWRLWVSGS